MESWSDNSGLPATPPAYPIDETCIAELKREVSEKEEGINYSMADKIKIIQQLRLMGTPVANELADKMEKGND